MTLYLIGSLRNPAIPDIANQLRAAGFEVFDDWHAAGERADDAWKEYEQRRGRSYPQALKGIAAKHVFEFDKRHLDNADAAVLVLPAGKSGHLELGYMVGRGKPTFVLLDNPDRWDVMYQFATEVSPSIEHLLLALRKQQIKNDINRIERHFTTWPVPLPAPGSSQPSSPSLASPLPAPLPSES